MAARSRPRARSCSPGGSGRAGWFPLAFLPPRPAARPSPELCPWVWRRRGEQQPGPGGGGGAAEALIRSGAAGRQGSIQRADKRRVCGAEPAGTESSAGGPLARPQTQRRDPAGAALTRPPAAAAPRTAQGRPRAGPAGGLEKESGQLRPSRSPRGPRRQTSAFPLQQRP